MGASCLTNGLRIVATGTLITAVIIGAMAWSGLGHRADALNLATAQETAGKTDLSASMSRPVPGADEAGIRVILALK